MATRYESVRAGRAVLGRIGFETDLLEELARVCREESIRLGRVEAIGAVRRACLGYYDQDAREYRYRDLDEHLEILALAGNVSLKDGEPVVHAHITLGNEEGRAFGGHLAPGTIVFACEFLIRELTGADLSRGFDEPTGLPLWPLS
jgi:uncharacterized protein